MMRQIYATIVLIIFAFTVQLHAQHQIKGQLVSVRDTSALYGAIIVLQQVQDSSILGTVADTAGFFEFVGVADGRYKMTIRYSSFLPIIRTVKLDGESIDLGVVPMFPDSSMLKTVIIKTNMIRVVQKNDTIEMNAAAFKTNPDASAEDLVAKMPGITVQNGEIKAQGETVQKVLVDGKEYFGDDASSVLKNMPADMVDKVQIFDQKSDQAIFSGVDDGNSKKAMNIVTKSQYSNATFGRIYAGYGTDNRYQAGFAINDFRQQQKITFLGNFNNVNQVNFTSQDMNGVSGGSSRSGRGGSSRGGADNNFTVGKQNGITAVNSFGINYANKWGPKLQLSTSYFMNTSQNANTARTDRTYYAPAFGNLYRQSSSAQTENVGHRANLRLEYNPDSVNNFVFAPKFSYQFTDYKNVMDAANYTTEDSINSTSSRNGSLNTSWNIGGSLNYRHRYKKPGRSLSVEMNGSYTDKIGTGDLLSRNAWYDVQDSTSILNQQSSLEGNSWNITPSITWSELLGKTGSISFVYSPSYAWNTSDKQTLSFDSVASDFVLIDTTVSSNFDNYVVSHKAGISYRLVSKNTTYTLGVDGMETEIFGKNYFPDSTSTKATFLNALPSASIQWKQKKRHSLRLNYRTATNVPSVSQLQKVVDNNNPLSLTSGNPDLKQSYSHTLFTRYSFTNIDKSTSLFVFVSGTLTTNYIGSSLLIAMGDTILPNGTTLGRGGQFTQPVNMNGYYVINHFGAYSLPLAKLKSNLNLNWSYALSSSPGLINGVKNIAYSNSFGAGAMLTSSISERVDFSFGWNGTYVIVQNTSSFETSNNYYYHMPTARLNLLFGTGFVFNSDFGYTSYRGLSSGFNQDFVLWNAALGYKFADRQQCELRISAFDILKQNNSLSRTISETYLEDVQTNVLTQYFMLTFTWNVKKFRGGTAPATDKPYQPEEHKGH